MVLMLGMAALQVKLWRTAAWPLASTEKEGAQSGHACATCAEAPSGTGSAGSQTAHRALSLPVQGLLHTI